MTKLKVSGIEKLPEVVYDSEKINELANLPWAEIKFEGRPTIYANGLKCTSDTKTANTWWIEVNKEYEGGIAITNYLIEGEKLVEWTLIPKTEKLKFNKPAGEMSDFDKMAKPVKMAEEQKDIPVEAIEPQVEQPVIEQDVKPVELSTENDQAQ